MFSTVLDCLKIFCFYLFLVKFWDLMEWGMPVVQRFSETFAIVSLYFVNGRLCTDLYSFLAMETLYFLHSLHSLEKLK